MWNNGYNNNFKRGGYNNYQRGGYNNNFQGGGYINQQPPKRSGCKMTKYTPQSGKNAGQEMFVMSGWRKTKTGFYVVKANPTSKSQQGPKGYIGSIAVEITNRSTGQKQFYWAVYHPDQKKVRIPDIGWVMNPNAPRGGYCGTSRKPKNR